jgi:hypothetical protein
MTDGLCFVRCLQYETVFLVMCLQYVALAFYFAHINVDGPMVNKLCGHNENQCPFDSTKMADLSKV